MRSNPMIWRGGIASERPAGFTDGCAKPGSMMHRPHTEWAEGLVRPQGQRARPNSHRPEKPKPLRHGPATLIGRRLIASLIALTLMLTCAGRASSEPVEFRFEVGDGVMATSQQISAGTPAFSMWAAGMPTTSRRTGAGFPVLSQAEHLSVWRAERREDGTYYHLAALTVFEGRFHAIWGNHPLGEDGRRWRQPDRTVRLSRPRWRSSGDASLLPHQSAEHAPR